MIEKIKTIFLLIRELKNWPIFFMARFGLWRPAMVVYVCRNGVKIQAPKNSRDWWIAYYEIFFKKYYNPTGFEIGSGDTVIDIGAHQGLFTLYASMFAKKIYAFEPILENFGLLAGNLRVNSIANVVPFNMAVSPQSGKQTIMVSPDSFAHSSFLKEGKAREVLAVSLADIVKKNGITQIDFLKMDCEGAEYDILPNCPKEILGMVKKISMECHYLGDDKNIKTMEAFLTNNNFTCTTKPLGGEQASYLYAKRND